MSDNQLASPEIEPQVSGSQETGSASATGTVAVGDAAPVTNPAAASVPPVSAAGGSILGKVTKSVEAGAKADKEPRQTIKKNMPVWAIVLLVLGGCLLLGSLFFNFIMMLFMAGDSSLASKGGGNYIEKTLEGKGRDKILYLQLEGSITSSPVEYGSSIRDKVVVDMLKQALADDTIKGAILEVNSPGGEVTASDKLNQAIKIFAHKKPLYFLMGDLCASGCVYMSTHASKLYAHPTTTTGSIGVIMHGFNLEKLLDKVGVRPVTIKSGEMKDILSSTREMTPEERAILQNMIMESYERFVNLVADGRHLEVEKVKEFADGRILTTSQAVAVGLVDKVAYFDTVKEDLQNDLQLKNVSIVTYKRPFSFMDFGESQMMKLPQSPLGQLTNNLTVPRLMYLWQLPDLE